MAAACQECGVTYVEATSRWHLKITSTCWARCLRGEDLLVGGRPSIVNKADTIKLVRQYLLQHSTDTSKLVKIEGQYVMQRGLTRSYAKLWRQSPEIRSAMSRPVFNVHCRRHHATFRKFKKQSDLCATCHKFDTQVMPGIAKKSR